MKFTIEQIQKASEANSADELLLLAKENGLDMSEEQAKMYYAELHKEGVLSDEELGAVTGGKGEPPTPKFQKGAYVDTSCGTGIVWSMEYSYDCGEWIYNISFGTFDFQYFKESEISLRNQ